MKLRQVLATCWNSLNFGMVSDIMKLYYRDMMGYGKIQSRFLTKKKAFLIILEHLGVSEHNGTPKPSHFNRGFPLFSPSILGKTHYFWETSVSSSCLLSSILGTWK